jgi:hypothetical protein
MGKQMVDNKQLKTLVLFYEPNHCVVSHKHRVLYEDRAPRGLVNWRSPGGTKLARSSGIFIQWRRLFSSHSIRGQENAISVTCSKRMSILRHFKIFVLKNKCKTSDASVRIRTVNFFRWIQHCTRSVDINDMGLNTCWCHECKYIEVIARINIIIQNYRGTCHWPSWPHSDLLCSLQMSISLPVLGAWHDSIQRDRGVQCIEYEKVKPHLNSVTLP